MRQPCIARLATIATILLLAGCANLHLNRKPPSPAKEAMAAGNYAKAARLYLQKANTAQGTQKQHDLAFAAQAAWKAGEQDLAQKTLTRIFPKMLKPTDRALADLVQARLHLAHDKPAAAIKFLATPPGGTPRARASTILKLRGQTLFTLKRPMPALQALDLRARHLSGAALRANNTMIWQALQTSRLPAENSRKLQTLSSTGRGWVALSRIARESWGNPEALKSALRDWRNQYPKHPATQQFAEQIVEHYEQHHRYPKKIALLLPLSGHLQAPAQVIRDGFLAGRFQTRSETPPTITVYDTGKTDSDAVQAYKKAVHDGAGVVVGPLTRSAVTAVASVANHKTPELTLNYPKPGSLLHPPSNVYRMGLSPTAEVRAAAREATKSGLTKALVLASDTRWGRSVVDALQTDLQKTGGSVMDTAYFTPGTTNFSKPIKKLLKDRREENTQIIPVGGVFIFIAGQPRDARLIRPQLRFYYAGHYPVYATASVYTGIPNPQKDEDEDGITFCDAPWILNPNNDEQALQNRLRKHWPQAFSHYPRLFALSLDAYRLVPAVNARALPPNKYFQGATGSLYNAGNGRIRRDLPCARFHDGKAIPLSEQAPESSAGQ